jgi:hypothetical protein
MSQPGATTPSIRDLIGLQLSSAAYAGNMRTFQFGQLLAGLGEYALHISCPWRIESSSEIVTGFHDWYQFVGDEEPEVWDPARGGSLQELRLRELFQRPPGGESRIVNSAYRLSVTDAEVDTFGGLRLVFDDRLRLVAFPGSSVGEHWRLFRPNGPGSHLVMEGPSGEGAAIAP